MYPDILLTMFPVAHMLLGVIVIFGLQAAPKAPPRSLVTCGPRRGNQAQAPAPQAVEIGPTGERPASYQARPRHLIWVPPGAPPAQEPVAPLHRPQRLLADARAVSHRHDGRLCARVPSCFATPKHIAGPWRPVGRACRASYCGRGYAWHVLEGVYWVE